MHVHVHVHTSRACWFYHLSFSLFFLRPFSVRLSIYDVITIFWCLVPFYFPFHFCSIIHDFKCSAHILVPEIKQKKNFGNHQMLHNLCVVTKRKVEQFFVYQTWSWSCLNLMFAQKPRNKNCIIIFSFFIIFSFLFLPQEHFI